MAGHIPGARYANLDRDLARRPRTGEGRHPLPEPAIFAATLESWGVSNDSNVVVYDDQGGAIAARLWWMLRWVGHESVVLLDGGLSSWVAAKLPLSTELPDVVPGKYRVDVVHDDWVVGTEELLANLGGPFRLLDARSRARFEGLEEPIDPVAGHIPGATSYPFDANLDEQGRILGDEALLEMVMASMAGGESTAPRIAMCGSGVTACHLILALEEAGLGNTRLYAGSWSEWIRDSERPVATGP